MKNKLLTKEKATCFQSFLNSAFKLDGNIKLATKSEFINLDNAEILNLGWLCFGFSKEKNALKNKRANELGGKKF